jgi:hypothetical protein
MFVSIIISNAHFLMKSYKCIKVKCTSNSEIHSVILHEFHMQYGEPLMHLRIHCTKYKKGNHIEEIICIPPHVIAPKLLNGFQLNSVQQINVKSLQAAEYLRS